MNNFASVISRRRRPWPGRLGSGGAARSANHSRSALGHDVSDIFGVGTIAGMMLITAAVAAPIAYSANRFRAFNRYVGAAAGVLSLIFGIYLVYQIGFVDGLFR
jgi:hypothetical protein